jgi:hypothetical protein
MKVVSCRNEILNVHIHFDTNCWNELFYSERAEWCFAATMGLEPGKDILISLPMDSTSSDLPLFRTIERQGFYDEWQECSPMALRSQYEIKTKTSLQWLVDLLPKALSCTRVKIKSYSKYPWKWETTALAPRSQFGFVLFRLTKKSGSGPHPNCPYLSSLLMNLLYRTKASYPLAEALSRGVGSSIKSRVDSTRNGPPGAKNSSATR